MNRPAILLTLLLSVLTACGSGFRYDSDPSLKPLMAVNPKHPDARFMVISDIHYFDSSMITGSRPDTFMNRDRKMLSQIGEIFDETLKEIKRAAPQFLLVCGDMTKDGELINHRIVASRLADISRAGIKVFVVPGNHDIDNPVAESYMNKKPVPADTVSAEQFVEIYNNAGYSSAIDRDSRTLSYTADPVEGLRLLALDSNRWMDHPGRKKYITAGWFEPSTLEWIESALIKAKRDGKAVIVMLHHGVLENFPGQKSGFPAWVLEDNMEFARLLAAYGVRAVFTGHYHAQDITLNRFPDGNFIFDIETGSLLTYPCPYRMVSIEKNVMKIRSSFINSIPSMGGDFREFKREFLYEGSRFIADYTLEKFFISEHDRKLITPQISRAFLVHMAGDENLDDFRINYEGIGFLSRIMIGFQSIRIEGWLRDYPPADNDVDIDLANGQYR
jgi:3',5'-cyclic AMP phosphodiesterase CpdA